MAVTTLPNITDKLKTCSYGSLINGLKKLHSRINTYCTSIENGIDTALRARLSYIYIYVCIYTHMYTYVYICIHIYAVAKVGYS